jgi:hypothetical protein
VPTAAERFRVTPAGDEESTSTRGVLVSVAGGEPHVAQVPGTVAAVSAEENVKVRVPFESDVNEVPFAAVMGISVVDPVYATVGVKIWENCPKAGMHPARPSQRAMLRARRRYTTTSSARTTD